MTTIGRAAQMMKRFDLLGNCSQDPNNLTRLYGSAALEEAIRLVAGWMQEAGMTVRRDPFRNLIGHFVSSQLVESDPISRPLFVIGGHLDTVRDAGKYDGTLGVLTGIAVVERLNESSETLPFDLEIVAFADEEGLRFHTNYLACRAYAGTFDRILLDRVDAEGISVRDAIAMFGGDPDRLDAGELGGRPVLGWIEAHIEQGPVLEAEKLPVGVVTDIAGQTRATVNIVGEAGHAGTVPMHLRKDALSAAAELALMAEHVGRSSQGLVATIGQLAVRPGASNVVPGTVTMTLDVRHALDERRQEAIGTILEKTAKIAAERGVAISFADRTDTPANACDEHLTSRLEQSIDDMGLPVKRLVSGAGHDAVALSAKMPVTMLFVRCKGGISHNPAESIETEDVAVAIEVLDRFLQVLAD